ncbi:MAG: L,D-transpeptidase [Hyphomicrobiales bacterium]|nr:L,D-transpeptidase [Hyphomicrobiales bacterium]
MDFTFANRRGFLKGFGACGLLPLTGCMQKRILPVGVDPITTSSVRSFSRPKIGIDPNITTSAQMYGEIQDGGYVLPAVPYDEMDYRYRRQRVPNTLGYPVDSVLIDTKSKFAYYVFARDEAVRYGVGVGKAGFEWTGNAVIGHKKIWPAWTPPEEMVQRKPELEKYRGGMPPGPMNPLGARALYLYDNGRDTLFRLHGTPEWQSIGKAMSSGCIRLLNHDIIDLFNRAPNGTSVTVI